MVPRYEYPGRIVLAVGLWTSSWCVVGLIHPAPRLAAGAMMSRTPSELSEGIPPVQGAGVRDLVLVGLMLLGIRLGLSPVRGLPKLRVIGETAEDVIVRAARLLVPGPLPGVDSATARFFLPVKTMTTSLPQEPVEHTSAVSALSGQ